MNLQPRNGTGRILRVQEVEYAPFEFVSELLSLIMTGSEKELRVESRDFFCDRRTGIEPTSRLKVNIDCEDVVETKDKIEITLSGMVANQLEEKTGFTLYFFMWWNRHAPVSIERKGSVHSRPATLNIHFEEKSEQLSDAVFDLLLYRKNPSFQRDVLGSGKGFLFVGSDQGIGGV
ncbi:MAG TPA: hypothetical protein ENK96_01785 [Desulfobulbaceae bacterium]|nr:hypothetical protein [Desulfobulbaceae bacterium]